jgi:glutathione-specific gamma-glutamylcyclotransferase
MSVFTSASTTPLPLPLRDPAPFLERALQEWGGQTDLWVFGYASLIWRPDFEVAEQRLAHVQGWHRALKMWSQVYRGTVESPGLVFALLSGGSCRGAVMRVPRDNGEAVMQALWAREMINGVYDPKWLRCTTPRGPVTALAFTLSRRSPSYTGELSEAQVRKILAESRGHRGTTLDYLHQTHRCLQQQGIHDHALHRLLTLAPVDGLHGVSILDT